MLLLMEESTSFGVSGIVRVSINILLGPTGSNVFCLGVSRSKFDGRKDFFVGAATDEDVD